MAKLSVNDSSIAAIADAVRERKESRSLMQFPNGFVSQIRTIGGQPEREVNFRDYDGIVIFSYTIADFLELTELPINPEHDGLVSQGWNWTLAGAQNYVRETGRKLDIGQLYITEDGSTKLYITVIDTLRPVEIGFRSEVADGILIDWGDGESEQSTATAYTRYEHAYNEPGDYVISLTVQNGELLIAGNYTPPIMMDEPYGIMGDNLMNKNRLTHVEIGRGIRFVGAGCFARCNALRSITMPRDVGTSMYMFWNCEGISYIAQSGNVNVAELYNCTALKWFSPGESDSNVLAERCYSGCNALETPFIPAGIAAIPAYTFQYCSSIKEIVMQDVDVGALALGRFAFSNCHSLAKVILNPNFTSIPQSAFSSCYSLTNITIPAKVYSIGESAFSYCYNMKEYHFLRETPPTLANTNVFTEIPDDCVMYVPRGCLEAYQTATNWSEYASYMQEEPEV